MSVRSLLLSLTALVLSSASATEHQELLQLPTTTAPPATARPPSHGYSYIGCWNETVGFGRKGGRALAEGRHFADQRMTISKCLEYCSIGTAGKGSTQYAGLELGRECYCSTTLSTLSEKLLNENSRCILSCSGNASEICGGQLALSLYNLTSIDSKTGGVGWSQFSGVAGYGTLALVTFVLAAVV